MPRFKLFILTFFMLFSTLPTVAMLSKTKILQTGLKTPLKLKQYGRGFFEQNSWGLDRELSMRRFVLGALITTGVLFFCDAGESILESQEEDSASTSLKEDIEKNVFFLEHQEGDSASTSLKKLIGQGVCYSVVTIGAVCVISAPIFIPALLIAAPGLTLGTLVGGPVLHTGIHGVHDALRTCYNKSKQAKLNLNDQNNS